VKVNPDRFKTVQEGFLGRELGDRSMERIETLPFQFPPYSQDLGIDLKEPAGRFRWFLASLLFGARISEKIAVRTYKTFERYRVLSPDRILEAGWDGLVRILDEGGYVRYDFSTATKLLSIAEELKERYGSLEVLYRESEDERDLKRRLKEFKGVGETTAQIFLRELRGIWMIEVPVSKKAEEAADRLEIDLDAFEGEELSRVETALIKLSIRYCRKRNCERCPLGEFCGERLV